LLNDAFSAGSCVKWLYLVTPDGEAKAPIKTDDITRRPPMKRILTAALLSSGILFAAGAAPASAEPGYGRGEFHRDGGFRDAGARGVDNIHYRHGWRHRHARRHCSWERVCFRNRWGVKRCHMERVCHPRWR
jgi:hypothetical protein